MCGWGFGQLLFLPFTWTMLSSWGDVCVSVTPDRKLRAALHCVPCSLFVAVSAAGFVACSLRVLVCSHEAAASLAFAETNWTAALTAAPSKHRPLTAEAPTYPLLPPSAYSCAHCIWAGLPSLCLTLQSLYSGLRQHYTLHRPLTTILQPPCLAVLVPHFTRIYCTIGWPK